MMTFSSSRPVLVVGAGPSGLTTALALAVRGVPVRVVDRSDAGANTSRAAVVHAATLSALESVGATEPLLERALRVPTFEVRDGRRSLARLSFAGLPSPYPFTAMVPQQDTEEILRTCLARRGVEVEWGTELEGLVQLDGGAEAHLVSGSSREIVRAGLVVGADGSRSRTRELAGIEFVGSGYDQSFVLADVEMVGPLARTDAVSLTFSPAGLLVVAPLPGGRHRVVATADQPPRDPDAAQLTHLLAERVGPAAIDEVHWSGRFRVSHRLASTFVAGHVVLVGDAAHVHSPAGGQGMNTGIRDALHLAGLVADGADLQQYEASRRPVAARVIASTDRMTRAATLRGPVRRGLRNAGLAAASRVPALRRAAVAELAGLTHE